MAGGLSCSPPGGDDEEASATVASLDGLVVTGGPDIDPVRYGAPRHSRTQAPATLRDAWDLAVASHALRLGVPLLAICRGMQVLNVCRGGTLHQHLPDLVGHGRHDGPAQTVRPASRADQPGQHAGRDPA